MSEYEIILYWSEPDHAFIAEVPELPGCAADGPTRQEAIANAEVIIQQWICVVFWCGFRFSQNGKGSVPIWN